MSQVKPHASHGAVKNIFFKKSVIFKHIFKSYKAVWVYCVLNPTINIIYFCIVTK